MTYVIESGLSEHGRNPMWTVIRTGYDNPSDAFTDLRAFARSLRVMYEPHGNRKLRVREIKP